ncbi:MAG: HAMP domain-containing protein [Candidatus Kapaibacterium sp.]|nr:MAG: HAMP domain-containing protein [Candidatus Kapabacteria bacterium]
MKFRWTLSRKLLGMAGVLLLFTMLLSGFALLSNRALDERENVRLIEISFLQSRQSDLDFVTFRQTKYALRVDSAVAACDSLVRLFRDEPTAERLNIVLANYKQSFDSTVFLSRTIGLNDTLGILGEVNSRLKAAEKLTSGAEADELFFTMQLCRSKLREYAEAAFMGRKIQKAQKEFDATLNFVETKARLVSPDPASQQEFIRIVEECRLQSEQLSMLAKVVEKNRATFKENVKAVRPILKEMAREKSSKAASYLAFSGIAIVLTIILSIGIALLLSRIITKPVNTLRRAARAVAQGDFTVRLDDVKSNDEIEDLAVSFQQMTTHIQSYIAELREEKASVQAKVDAAVRQISEEKQRLSASVETILHSMEEFSNGNLTVKLTVTSNDDIGKLYDGFNAAVSNIRLMVDKVADAAENTATANTEITQQVQHLIQGLSQQADQMEAATLTVGEINSTIHDNSRKTVMAAHDASGASNDAAQSETIVEEMIREMSVIGEAVSHSASVISELGKSSKEIGKIAQVIEGIADQTNLLALNAAIEAARAGEQGRGFAVVADEVRFLAERTQQATKQITIMIDRIQSDTGSAIKAMKAGKDRVERGQSITQDAGSALHRIIDRTENVAKVVENIAAASEQQASMSGNIVRTIQTVQKISAESGASIQQIRQSVQRLGKLTNNLQGLLNFFKLDEADVLQAAAEAHQPFIGFTDADFMPLAGNTSGIHLGEQAPALNEPFTIEL